MKYMELEKSVLLLETKRSVELEKQSTLVVLEYLAAVDCRQLWKEEGYSSLQDFCVRYLNYSESEAWRRIQAARCLLRVPEAKPLLARNDLSLSGLSLIAPHLTPSNASEMLPLVERQSTREIAQVLAEHFDVVAPAEFLNLPIDEELRGLLMEAGKLYGQKDRLLLIKRALKEVVSKRPRRVLKAVKHTRVVSAALRRHVMESDGHRCSYQSPTGVRCNQTAHLQIDHIRPWAKGGSSREIENLRVLCRAHNLMLGSKDFPGLGPAARAPLAREVHSGGVF